MTKQERWKPHVTVAAVIERNGRYLLVEEQTRQGVLLNNPAGHLDPGESPIEAAVRETLEETAHAFTPEAFLGIYMGRYRREVDAGAIEDVTFMRLAFTGTVGEAIAGRSLDEGIIRTLWMSLDELRACPERHRSPLLLPCIEDHAAGRRLPLEAFMMHASVHQPQARF